MQIELSYNSEKVNFNLPDTCQVDYFKPKSDANTLGYDDFIDAFKNANANLFFESDSILFVLNDAHRSTPTAELLAWLKKYNRSILDRADFLIACGTHQPPDDLQYRKIFGDLFDELKLRISYHDCHDMEAKSKIGTDSYGRDFYLNKQLFDYDAIFVINSVEPHYFAGFTGGRKSLVPGLADFKTIERNHNLANSLDCMPMKLDGNPMAHHLEELLSLVNLPNVLTLQVVYDSQKAIKHLCFGSITNAFTEAVDYASDIYACTSSKKYDLVFMEVLPPLDKSVYQIQKALENCQLAVKNKGTAIIIAACIEGKGSDHFFELANKWDKVKNKPIDGKLHFGSHKLSRVNSIGKRIDVKLYSEQPQELVSQVFYNALENPEEYINEKYNNKNIDVAVVYDAAHAVMRY